MKPPRKIEIIKKDICSIFNNHGLKITIQANKKIVDFLDVSLNLSTQKYQPFTKPNNIPLYVHNKSNHPPKVLENIPAAINKRLSEISSDEDSFQRAVPLYQEALTKSGYQHKLKYQQPPTSQNTINSRSRKRNITWYNPPFSKNVATNVGQTFLKILDDEFPAGHILHKIFNRNTVKISYSCMSNFKQNIDGHNKSKLSHRAKTPDRKCNCQKPSECPMSKNCLAKSVIYQATVKTSDERPTQTYVGLTENEFKTRYTNHKASFNNYEKRNSTELSKYIWNLKNNNISYSIRWKILKRARSYSNASKRCNLCIWEKYFIICKPDIATLNRRNELVSTCRHANKYLLKNFIT